MKLDIRILLIYTCFTVVKCEKKNCGSLKVNHMLLLNRTILTQQLTGISQCAKLCWQHNLCASISYLRTDFECRLNFVTKDVSLSTYKQYENGVYIPAENFLQYGLVDKPRYPCSTSQKYILTKNNHNFCVPVDIGIVKNAALNKPTNQISNLEGYGPVQAVQSSCAVDGIWTSNFYDNGCAHTSILTNPWWYVDLVEPSVITKILILNRSDANAEALSDITVYYGLTLDKLDVYGTFPGPGQAGQVTIKNDSLVVGRYVKIVKYLQNTFLTLCEVAVYVPGFK